MMIVMYIWIRGTWPRVRVDQLMGFAWKFLLPMAVVNIVAVGIWYFAPSKPVGWVVAAAWLGVWFVVLAKVNAGQTLEKREYRYV
jgi:NADH-quinone oxidoreductase subunit H